MAGAEGSRDPNRSVIVRAVVAWAVVFGVLHVANERDFLLFHSMAEGFSVLIAGGIFLIAWNTRGFADSGVLLLLGLCYPFVGLFDFLHMLAYDGMGVFNTHGADIATQLWIAGRFVEAGSLVAAAFLVGRRIRTTPVLLVAGTVSVLLLAAIRPLEIFPACYVAGSGLTAFKVWSEYAIGLLLLVSALALHRHRRSMDPTLYRLLLASVLLTIGAELAFTSYRVPKGTIPFLGHCLKILSFYCIYKAMVEMSLRAPYRTLFRGLKRSEETLREANRELERYARTVSHDLRGPISAISNANEVIRRSLEEPGEGERLDRLRRMTEMVHRNVESAVSLIDRLLELARAGQEPRKAVDVDVAEVVGAVLEQHSAETSTCGVRIEVGEGLGTVRAEPTHVFQIFANLLANALRHAGREGGRISVVRQPDTPDGLRRFVVRDDGPGIPEESLPRLFDSFYRGENGGTGLGLAIVSRIVAKYGGELSARNEDGAVFEFTLRDWPV